MNPTVSSAKASENKAPEGSQVGEGQFHLDPGSVSQGVYRAESPDIASDVAETLNRFLGWLETTNYESYDPYDLWGTRYGLFARKTYYKRPLLGIPLVAPVLLGEILCPGLRRAFVHKTRFATADAQLALAHLNLYRVTGQPDYLARATTLCEDLLEISVPGYRGHCWGYPFDWQNSGARWRKDTPFITSTPYCFEAFLALYDATGDEQWLEISRSVATFVSEDLNDTPIAEHATASSYSPIDKGTVVNASAYRAYVLLEADSRFDLPAYAEQGRKNLNFVLFSQHANGSWPYAWTPDGKGSFIDHFHTCFVLKNLCKSNRHVNRGDVKEAIRKGCAWYRENLYYPDDSPRPYAMKPRTQIVRHELYDFAEAITLGVLLHHDWPEGYLTAQRLATRVGRDLQTSKGFFVTRVYRGGMKHQHPFLRWPQAQLFYALTNLLASTVSPEDSGGVGVGRPAGMRTDSRSSAGAGS